MLRAEAQTFDCFSGTIFGREVVPDVCSTSAMSSACAGPPVAAALPLPAKASLKRPAPCSGIGFNRATATPSFSATAIAGDSGPLGDDEKLRLEIGHVELELVGLVGRVQRRRGRAGGDRDERRSHLRPVRQHDGDAVAAPDAVRVEIGDRAVDELAQPGESQRAAPGRGERRRVVGTGLDEIVEGLGSFSHCLVLQVDTSASFSRLREEVALASARVG